MSLLSDILASYRNPGPVLRRWLAGGVREDRALALLMGAGVLIFVAQAPRLARAAALDPSQPLDARLAGALMASVFLLPLLAYGLAALSHLAARLLGGRGSFFAARLALFWALFATAPLMLLHGLLSGLSAPGALATGAGLLVFVAFLWIWLAGLWQVETEKLT